MRFLVSVRRAQCKLGGLILSSAISLTFVSTAAAAPVQKQGYIPMADGTQLEYTVELPASTGRFPVALQYAGYCEGTSPTCNAPNSTPALLAAGYAVLGVSIRGTSCSTGTFNAFTDQEWSDGAAAVEWAARQPWSDGHVGMYGDSFPGIMQVGVAGLRPAHLDAIAPWQVSTDLYRDVGYPGGITDTGFGAFWAGVDQPLNSYASGLQQAEATGDTTCVEALLHDLADEPTNNVALNALQHPFDDSFWQAHHPGANASRIDIPTFGCLTWQDDEVSSRGSSYLSKLDPARTWVVASNGYHGMCELSVTAGGQGAGDSPLIIDELIEFFDRYVKGVHNGFETKTPHIQLWHETHANSVHNNVPRWITRFKSYSSIPVEPLALYFRSSGELSLTPPTGTPSPHTYAYPGPATGTENGDVFGQNGLLWKGQEPPGASVGYTTPALAHDTEFFGSGSADIWLSSTAPRASLPQRPTPTSKSPSRRCALTDRSSTSRAAGYAPPTESWIRSCQPSWRRTTPTSKRIPSNSRWDALRTCASSCGHSTTSFTRGRASACGSMRPRGRPAAGRSTSPRPPRSTASTRTPTIHQPSSSDIHLMGAPRHRSQPATPSSTSPAAPTRPPSLQGR